MAAVCLLEKRAGLSGGVGFHTTHVMAGLWCQHEEAVAESSLCFSQVQGTGCVGVRVSPADFACLCHWQSVLV